MRLVAILLLCLCLYISPAKAEILWGDLPLDFAEDQEREDALSTILYVSYLDYVDDLKVGDIIFLDIVGENCLIAVNYEDLTQIWVWTIQGEFQYGYEIQQTYHPISATNRSFCLTPDGTILVYLGRGGSIVGLSALDGQPIVSVYSTPDVIENLEYNRPSRSAYKRYYRDKGKVIVTSPGGELITVIDFSDEYMKYQSEKNIHILPYAIMIMILLGFFLCTIAWLIKNNTNDPPSPLL